MLSRIALLTLSTCLVFIKGDQRPRENEPFYQMQVCKMEHLKTYFNAVSNLWPQPYPAYVKIRRCSATIYPFPLPQPITMQLDKCSVTGKRLNVMKCQTKLIKENLLLQLSCAVSCFLGLTITCSTGINGIQCMLYMLLP